MCSDLSTRTWRRRTSTSGPFKTAKYEEALETYTKSLDIMTRIYGGDDHPDVAASKENIGLAFPGGGGGDLSGGQHEPNRGFFSVRDYLYLQVHAGNKVYLTSTS